MAHLHLTIRRLLKTPWFTLGVITLLAVGIGMTTGIFSLLDAVLLRPLPVHKPQELVRFVQKTPQGKPSSEFPYLFYESLVHHSTTLAAVFGEMDAQVTMAQPLPAEEIHIHLVTPEFFSALGVSALYGRTLVADDANQASATPPMVLSYGFARRRFGANRDILGQTIVLHGHPFIIAGIMPRDFNGTSVDTSPEAWIPFQALPLIAADRNEIINPFLELAGRLKPATTEAEAFAESQGIWRNAIKEYWREFDLSAPGNAERLAEDLKRGVQLEPLVRGVSVVRERYQTALLLLIVSAGLLQFMLCANLAALMLARNAGRSEEIAVRLALGASRRILVTQMFLEGAVLAALGGIGGVGISYLITRWLVHALPPIRDLTTSRLALSIDIGVDGRVLLFSLAVSTITAILFALIPAVTSSLVKVDSVLRGARSTPIWGGQRFALMIQIALCTLLLAEAGLLVRTLQRLHEINAGFDPNHIISFTLDPLQSGFTSMQAAALRSQLTLRISELPGILSVATARFPLMRGSGMKMIVAPTGRSIGTNEAPNTSINEVSAEYFRTIGVEVLAGHGLIDSTKPPPRPMPVVVNAAFVRHFFPDVSPVGRRFGTRYVPDAFEIVGVVSDAKYRSLREPVPATFYEDNSEGEGEAYRFTLYVRTRMQPEDAIAPVRRQLRETDPALPLLEIHTLSEEVDASISGDRLTAVLASTFGVFSALLVSIGIYGFLAFVVAESRKEIAIHLAFGASRLDISRLIALRVLRSTLFGILIGLGAALLLGPTIRSLLYGIAPTDPLTLFTASAIVTLVAFLGATVPTFRATTVNPALRLRYDN